MNTTGKLTHVDSAAHPERRTSDGALLVEAVITEPPTAGRYAELRAAQAARPLRPYEVLLDIDHWSPTAKRAADQILNTGWTYRDFAPIAMRPPIAWDEVCAANRSWDFQLQCWTPVGPLLAAYEQTGEAAYFDRALEIALDWIGRYRSLEDAAAFAWYDMAIGVRAYRLGYITDVVLRRRGVPDETVDSLLQAVLLHARALANDADFPAHSNHGIYFAAGQAALAVRFPELPGMDAARVQASDRLRRLLETQFTVEGVHREHSPDYHRMVLSTFEGLQRAGLIEADALTAFIDRIQEALAWFVQPNGRLVMFGDSPHRLMTDLDWQHVQNDALRFTLSGGREGRPPAETVRAFPASGYIVFRDAWLDDVGGGDGGSYLAQACAFHSRTHKHADDLTFVWYDRGHEILTDAGGYGYVGKTEVGSELWEDGFWYADPNRVYVESTRAHNTVEIDGRNLPRRNVKAYGSAFMRWAEHGGVYVAESGVCHWDSLYHRRLLAQRPGEWLLVFDWLHDDETRPHEFVQRFHFAPELEVADSDGGRMLVQLPGMSDRLHVLSLTDAELVEPVRGQTDPLLGWISRQNGQLTPCWTAGYSAADRPGHTFATLFAFGTTPPYPAMPVTQSEVDAARFRVRWSQSGRLHTLSFARPIRGPLAVDYRIGVVRGRER
jgi:hypothetical protein